MVNMLGTIFMAVRSVAMIWFMGIIPVLANAQESPYFVAYDDHMAEPGTLEIEFDPVFGKPKGGNKFVSGLLEFEYGAKAWWTSSFYLDGQSTSKDSTIFTGWRWENRFRPLMRQHWINPVLYVEYEDLNGADKTLKTIVGFDSGRDIPPNAEARAEREHELELKLILSSNFKGWNLAENLIAEKNLSGGAWEFGYAIGVNRPLGLAASPEECILCPENIRVGLELYGGLGDRHDFTLAGTSHYIGPVIALSLPSDVTIRVEPTWGLTRNSHHSLLRFGISHEISAVGRRLRNLFR